MTLSLVLALNNIDNLKHILYKDYQFPKEISMLNRTQERILMTIKYGGEMTMVNIARAIGIEKGPFSQSVDKLEELQLLTRHRSDNDKRIVFLKLTRKGKKLTQIVQESMEQHFANSINKLEPSELESLLNALETISKTAQIINAK